MDEHVAPVFRHFFLLFTALSFVVKRIMTVIGFAATSLREYVRGFGTAWRPMVSVEKCRGCDTLCCGK